MKSGFSASKACASCSSDWPSTRSDHHVSRPWVQSTSSPVRLTTTTCSTGVSPAASAVSTAGLRLEGWPLRKPPSAVMTTRASASWIRERSASEEKPPNTTECGAPRRAQASIAMTVSGIIGM